MKLSSCCLQVATGVEYPGKNIDCLAKGQRDRDVCHFDYLLSDFLGCYLADHSLLSYAGLLTLRYELDRVYLAIF